LGISPESREAVDAVVVADADRIIIDGYNVAGAVLFEAFSSRAGREAAIARADMLKRATSASVTVVFDAANVKGDSRFTTDDGTRVLFEPEQSADDAIVFLVQETDDRCIVITNDRELQTRVGRPNCVAVFTTALIEWSEHLNER
jgi:predicted RNA-binding protein with PIN domain